MASRKPKEGGINIRTFLDATMTDLQRQKVEQKTNTKEFINIENLKEQHGDSSSDGEDAAAAPAFNNRFTKLEIAKRVLGSADASSALLKASNFSSEKSPTTDTTKSSSAKNYPPGANPQSEGTTTNSATTASKKAPPPYQQRIRFLLVLDFEATCEEYNSNWPHEIIEFPVVVVDTLKQKKIAEFHSYVKPTRNPKLTEFCTKLTGITQAQVDAAPLLPEVVKKFNTWFDRTIPKGHTVCFATDGPWDLRDFMHKHSVVREKVSFPPLFYRWVNVRSSYADCFKCKPSGIARMLTRQKMGFEGRAHCGLDDARNIARIVIVLLQSGYVFKKFQSVAYDGLITDEDEALFPGKKKIRRVPVGDAAAEKAAEIEMEDDEMTTDVKPKEKGKPTASCTQAAGKGGTPSSSPPLKTHENQERVSAGNTGGQTILAQDLIRNGNNSSGSDAVTNATKKKPKGRLQ